MKQQIPTKYISSVDVIDPDSGGLVAVEIRKLETGALLGIDGSWLEQEVGPVYSPYDPGVELLIPDDEIGTAEAATLRKVTDPTASRQEPCECEEEGFFCSGVPGVLAHMENGRLAPGAKVERCDACERFASDEAAYAKLVELGLVDVQYEVHLALQKFVDTINSTGGVLPNAEEGYVVPAADHDWIDLGDAYLLACRALGQQPRWADDATIEQGETDGH